MLFSSFYVWIIGFLFSFSYKFGYVLDFKYRVNNLINKSVIRYNGNKIFGFNFFCLGF